MTLDLLLTLPCFITTRSATATLNAYNEPVYDPVVTSAVCDLQQRQRSETTSLGELSETSWLLVLPAGTPVDQTAIVTIDGCDYELDGDPWEARNPRTGVASHIEATVRRVNGPDDDQEQS